MSQPTLRGRKVGVNSSRSSRMVNLHAAYDRANLYGAKVIVALEPDSAHFIVAELDGVNDRSPASRTAIVVTRSKHRDRLEL